MSSYNEFQKLVNIIHFLMEICSNCYTNLSSRCYLKEDVVDAPATSLLSTGRHEIVYHRPLDNGSCGQC